MSKRMKPLMERLMHGGNDRLDRILRWIEVIAIVVMAAATAIGLCRQLICR